MWYITLTCKQQCDLLNFEVQHRYEGRTIEADHPEWPDLLAKFNNFMQIPPEAVSFVRQNHSIYFIPVLQGSDVSILMMQRNGSRNVAMAPASLSFFDPSLSHSVDRLKAILRSGQVKNVIGRVNVRYFSDKYLVMDDLDIRGELTGFWNEVWRRIKGEPFVNIILALISMILALWVVVRLGLSLVLPLTAMDGLSLLAPLISTAIILVYYLFSSFITIRRCQNLRFFLTAGKRLFFHLEKWEP